MIQKDIGAILVEMGVITQDQYVGYEQESRTQGVHLEQYLVDQQVVSQHSLAKAYARKFEAPYIDRITEKMIDTQTLSHVPLRFLRDNAVIPATYEGAMYLVVADPYAFDAIDEVRHLIDQQIPMALAAQETIIDALNRFYPIEGTKEMIAELEEEEEDISGAVNFEAIREEDILGMASEAPVIKLVNHILYQAVQQGASDIHIEPYEKELRIRYRIDGVLYNVMSPPKRVQPALISRIKIMAQLNIAEKRQPQDGRIQVKVADRPIDIRVSVLPVTHGERIVMRLLDKSKSFKNLHELDWSERDYHVIQRAIQQPNGIILLTGPTGSGKTSTLYAILQELNTPRVNIMTVEDPVEYQVSGIAQIQVHEKVNLTFAMALRSILRQDPDIVMVGEMRDKETGQISVQAALTGHLVLSTLHTNSAPATITRLIDMGIESYLIASTLMVVVAQRLVRRLCNACKTQYEPELDVLRQVGVSQEEARTIPFYKAQGCEECMQTGYSGRLAIFEVMVVTEELSRMITEGVQTSALRKQARKDGMHMLIEDGLRKVKQGKTTLDEVLSVAATQEEM